MSDYVEDMAIVPVGITKNREGLTDLRIFTQEEAAAMVKEVTLWQAECRKKLGRSFVYLGDEFYILAGLPMPPADWYDGFPQLENGIGLTQNFLTEWEKAAALYSDEAPSTHRNYCIPVGDAAYEQLKPAIDAFNRHYHTENRLIPIHNHFFGCSINVTGLLTGTDLLEQLPENQPVILPSVLLNQDNLFLDDMSLEEFIRRSRRTVKVANGAAELYSLLLEQPLPHGAGTLPRNSVPERGLPAAGNNTEYVRQF